MSRHPDEDDITASHLHARVEAACRAALASGALGPIDTREVPLTDQGIGFRLRTVAGLARKQAATERARARGADGGGAGGDPFSPPYETDLYVGPVAPAHVGLLNKYPVLADHLLVVTRTPLPQTDALEPADCEALLRVLAAGDGLAFYNGGETAGASQPHRHLQWVALDTPPPLAGAMIAGRSLGFAYACEPVPSEWLADPGKGAAALHRVYRRLLASVGLVPDRPSPYNLLATRDQVWVVPRARAASAGIAINALGYAGFMLAADSSQAERVRTLGPLTLLADAATD